MMIWFGTFGLWAAIGLVTGAFDSYPSYEECLKQEEAGQVTEECKDVLSRLNEPMMPF